MPWNSSDLETLAVNLTYPLQVNLVWETAIAKFPSQMEQRISYQTAERYSFSARTVPLTSSALTALTALWVAVQGQLIPFKWTYNSAVRYVRFNQNALVMENVFTDYWVVQISLIDVHASEIIVDD
jgi:hypothetical protein